MSYLHDYEALGPMELGALSTAEVANLIRQIPALISAGQSTLSIARELMADPHLQEAICVGRRVANVIDDQPPGPKCRRTGPVSAARLAKGAGLHKALTPARLFVLHKQRPWMLPAAIAGGLGLVFAIGYFTGKGRK